MSYLWVAIGGALGSVGRFWLSGLAASRFGETFPWGTLLVNVTGSFVIGILSALTSPEGRFAPSSRVLAVQLLMVGVCGGYTTFSSFSLQTLELLRTQQWLHAGANILLSVALCLIAVWLGYLLGASFNSMKGN
jgi:CrcB protein